MDVEALVRPVVESVGLELWEVTYRKERGRMILRVAVDRDGGVDLDTIAQTSERLSRRLDLEGFAGTTP
jgi:ribosome maturation factor RimP